MGAGSSDSASADLACRSRDSVGSEVTDMQTYALSCSHLAVSEIEQPLGVTLMCPVCVELATVTELASKPKTQSAQPPTAPARSYGCSFGCGNPYDFVIVSIADGTTEFPCMPCFVKLASDVLTAMTEGVSPEVAAELAAMTGDNIAPMNGSGIRARGKNAPVDTDDSDLVEAFDSRVTVDELGDEFK
jgi:hypothetical protein